MTDNRFDDSLKNKIRDHRSPVPDDMWERIIQKKDKDRRGFLFFFRWFAILMLGVCLGGYLLMNHTKQKPEPSKHELSNQDQKRTQEPPASNLNKEELRTEENSSSVAQHLPISKKGSYSSNPFPMSKEGSDSSHPGREVKENKGNFKSVSEEKAITETAVSETVTNGTQNSTLQKDSLIGEKDDSVLSTKGVVNKPLPVVKPLPQKLPADSAQKDAVKKQ